MEKKRWGWVCMMRIYRFRISIRCLLFFLWMISLGQWYTSLVTYQHGLGQLFNLFYVQAHSQTHYIRSSGLETRHQNILKFPTQGRSASQGQGGSLLEGSWEERGVLVWGHRIQMWKHSVSHLAGLPDNGRPFRGRWLCISCGDCLAVWLPPAELPAWSVLVNTLSRLECRMWVGEQWDRAIKAYL